MSRRVYLAGPIDGIAYYLSQGWREEASRVMREHFDLRPVNPLESEADFDLSDHELVNRDRYLLAHCDAVLVDARRPGWGTAMEIKVAHDLGIPVVAWGTTEDDAGVWLRYHSTRIEPDMTPAIEYVAGLLL